jgi:hypothetical protein
MQCFSSETLQGGDFDLEKDPRNPPMNYVYFGRLFFYASK